MKLKCIEVPTGWLNNANLTIGKEYTVLSFGQYGISLSVFDDTNKWNYYDIKYFVPVDE